MSGKGGFSLRRTWAVLKKEFTQLRRDTVTLRMVVMIPIIQLLLFGYALNSDPRHLPTTLMLRDDGPFIRTMVAGLKNAEYFAVEHIAHSEQEAHMMLQQGKTQFVVSVPENFTRDLIRNRRPQILVESDSTDPTATAGALAALSGILQTAMTHDLVGPLAYLRNNTEPVDIRLHRMYNPEGFTRYNIVPGLIAIILTMTGIMMTALAVTRERERGTMENLLAMPVKPLEVMAGKIMPYVIIGYIQSAIIVLMARFLFDVPIIGSLWLLSGVLIVFIACNLAIGFTLSAAAENQTQAMQMSMMVTLPSFMLSGFLFPFRGMPLWAQAIGSTVPATYFIRIARGILLKGNDLAEIWPNLWPLLVFMLVITALAMKRYRRTLD